MSATNPSTYTESKAALDEIAEETTRNKSRAEQLVNDLRGVQSALQAMQSNWATAVAFIQSQADANGADADWQRMASEKNKLVADFIASRNAVNALIAAIDAV